jgi:hypothetical protein
MSRWIVTAVFLGAALVAGCGSDGSGVSGSKELGSLSDGEVADLCAYLVDVEGSLRTIRCDGDVTVTVGDRTEAECTAELRLTRELPDCTATVDEAEICSEDLADLSDADRCDDAFPLSCLALLECVEP